jgi:hypothetical protein
MANSQEIVDKILGKKDVTLLGKGKTKGVKPNVEGEFKETENLYDNTLLKRGPRKFDGKGPHFKGKGCRR